MAYGIGRAAAGMFAVAVALAGCGGGDDAEAVGSSVEASSASAETTLDTTTPTLTTQRRARPRRTRRLRRRLDRDGRREQWHAARRVHAADVRIRGRGHRRKRARGSAPASERGVVTMRLGAGRGAQLGASGPGGRERGEHLQQRDGDRVHADRLRAGRRLDDVRGAGIGPQLSTHRVRGVRRRPLRLLHVARARS